MKKMFLLILILLLAFCSACKEDEIFDEPEILLNKWANAAKHFNYNDYASVEAYPKSRHVFSETFSGFYPSDIMVVDVEDFDKNNIYKDHRGDRYYKRNVEFMFTQINRQEAQPEGKVIGDVDFVKYIDGEKNNMGWLMLNRTMIRVFE